MLQKPLERNAVAVSTAMAAEADTPFVITSGCSAKKIFWQIATAVTAVATVTAHAMAIAGLPQ